MSDSVFKKFPNHIKDIQALLEKDTVFREICNDYEEISTWLSGYCRSVGMPCEECDRARELIRALENEIARSLDCTRH